MTVTQPPASEEPLSFEVWRTREDHDRGTLAVYEWSDGEVSLNADYSRSDEVWISHPADRRRLAHALLARADLSTRFAPGDLVSVADGPTVAEYVAYLGGPFQRHAVRLVWPDGTRSPHTAEADDWRVEPATEETLALVLHPSVRSALQKDSP